MSESYLPRPSPEAPGTHVLRRPLRLGTRGSLLARAQSQWVADELHKRRPDVQIELKIISTTGDRITNQPLRDAGGKGLFTKEIEQALLSGEIDFAVHSFKDVPVTDPLVDQTELSIAAVPLREDVRDVLVSSSAQYLANLPEGAVVGTSSLRRRCQILSQRTDLRIEPLRGNIDTRLRRQREGRLEAVILAMAGLKRTNLLDPAVMTPMSLDEMLPAPGQGALAVQCRRDNAAMHQLLQTLHDPPTAACVGLERELVRRLQGDCHSPIAALAQIIGSQVLLRAAVGARDGALPVLRADSRSDASAALAGDYTAAAQVWRKLEAAGVRELLAG